MLYREMNELHILQYWLQSGCDDEQGSRKVDAREQGYPKIKTEAIWNTIVCILYSGETLDEII